MVCKRPTEGSEAPSLLCLLTESSLWPLGVNRFVLLSLGTLHGVLQLCKSRMFLVTDSQPVETGGGVGV